MMPGELLSRFRWRRWYAPLVVLVGLIVDYASPAAMWTAAIPLGFVAVLSIARERRAALAVLCLSSWIAIPVVAGAVRAVDSARGVQRLFVVGQPSGSPQGRLTVTLASGAGTRTEQVIPLAHPGYVRIDFLDVEQFGLARPVVERVAGTLADMHNALVGVPPWDQGPFPLR